MHVVVTGSSRGIGRELKTRLTERGDRVTGTSRDHSSGTRLDVSDPGQQARFAAQIKGDPVDLLICNAGVYLDKSMALKDYTAEVWAKSLAVNVTGVFLISDEYGIINLFTLNSLESISNSLLYL